MHTMINQEGNRVRVATLSRVSTEKDTQEMSIENQELLFNEYCARNGYEIVKQYVEKGSGVKMKRKVIEDIKEDMKEKKFDMLLVKDLSRLARNVQIALEIINLANEQEIKLLTPSDTVNAQLGSSLSSPMITFLCMIYQMESENTSARIKSTILLNQRQGKVHGSTPPYGYSTHRGQFEIRNDGTVEIVRRIFLIYLSGTGIDTIAKQFNNEGVSTPSQVLNKRNQSLLWGGSTVKGILTNRAYVGDLIQGKSETLNVTSNRRKTRKSEDYVIFEQHHEAIIDREQFKMVQELMASKKKISSKPQTHLFTNILFCEGCGRGLWYRSTNAGGRYVCGGRSKYGIKGCPAPSSIKEQELLNILSEEFHGFIEEIESKDYWRQLQQSLEGKRNGTAARVAELNEKIEVCKKRIENITMDYYDGKVQEDIYQRIITQTNETVDRLEYDLEELKSIDEEIEGFKSYDELKQELLKFTLDKELYAGNMILRFIERFVVNSEKDVVVSYRFR